MEYTKNNERGPLRFMYEKAWSWENIAPLCSNSAKIFKIWNNMVLKNLIDLSKRKKKLMIYWL